MPGRGEVLCQQLGLIVVAGAGAVAIDLLQADDVGPGGFDNTDHALEVIATILPADPLMDVVAQDAQRRVLRRAWLATAWIAIVLPGFIGSCLNLA